MIEEITGLDWIPLFRDCVIINKNTINKVIPAKAGIQMLLIFLDSPVSSTGQALRRAKPRIRRASLAHRQK